jgi:hypothetical protein
LGIPREEALKMSTVEVKELFLAHQFIVEAERRRLQKKRERQKALTETEPPTTLLSEK